MTLVGLSRPFRIGCHCLASSGYNAARLFVTESLWLKQKGQRVYSLVLLTTGALHMWSGPFGHFHQTRRDEPAWILDGLKLPFFVGCHSLAISGASRASELVPSGAIKRPEQNGQRLPDERLMTSDCHS